MEENQIDNKKLENSSLNLLDIIMVFLKHKKKIFLITSIVFIISIILYFFVFELIYLSEASVKSSAKSTGLLGALDGGLSDLGGIDDFGLTGGKSSKEIAVYSEILMSRRCLEELIKKFDLIKRDEYEFMEDAVKDFRENKLILKSDKISGVLSVGVYDKNRVVAKEMVDFLLYELNKINIEMNILNAKNNREFIEKRYYQAKEDLTKAEDSIKAFQLIYGIAPDLQIKASAQSVFTLEAELKAEEVKLDVIKKILSIDQPEVKLQEAKVNSLRNQISGIETSTDLNDFLRLGNSPQIAMSFLRLQRDVEIQNKILSFILPIYEQSKIEEKRETPTILILDAPYVSERKAKPKRLTMVLIITALAFLLTNTFFIFNESSKKYREEILNKLKN